MEKDQFPIIRDTSMIITRIIDEQNATLLEFLFDFDETVHDDREKKREIKEIAELAICANGK